ncbi:glycosyltransferase [Hoeflea alexandrii]|nr:glycosyltransferase [Hoeflea alexandrii]MCY0151992.1 glycosyltransferase [Hoeflea alexandrii]
MDDYRSRLRDMPGLRDSLAIASPATIRKAVWQADAAERVRRITFELDQDRRDASARRVMTGSQGFLLGLAVYLSATCLVLWPFAAFTVLHIVLTLFFSGGILLRLCALVMSAFRRNRTHACEPPSGTRLPVYTVLIALHDEAEMIPAIVSRISALRWPKSLLDVKYVCEIDDTATISALQAQQLGPECEIVLTPDFGPRTKPKALQYALQGARGSLVAVYDAEDKPAPGQLLEACAAFAEGDDRLGCVQAPLAIANLGTNWISGLFALEYSGLFRVLIPFLARVRMPIPLGGTSNHFRRVALEAAERMGSAQCDGGRGSRPPPLCPWLPYRDAEQRNRRNRPLHTRGLDTPANTLAQGLGPDLAGGHAPSRCTLSGRLDQPDSWFSSL